jgi:deoxyribodipyrimidine photo-lyase
MMRSRGLVWLRRDLRLDDHAVLDRAARECDVIACAFVLDPVQLTSDRIGPANVQCFFESLERLRDDLRALGSDLALLRGDFATELVRFAQAIGASRLYYGTDFEPQARTRDAAVLGACAAAGISVTPVLDQVCFGPDQIRKDDGTPYTVFTPFKRRWLERFEREPALPIDSRAAVRHKLLDGLTIGATPEVPKPEQLGFQGSGRYPRGGSAVARELLDRFTERALRRYADDRNSPALDGTSQLSPHLRAGTIGIRNCVAATQTSASRGSDVWLSELIWREFYMHILANFPHVASGPFVRSAERIEWRDADDEFAAWSEGRTGYPIVDAAMRQLHTTGWMHNRTRMIVASFLTKDLLIDYRRGERVFERLLADADLAANNGGWQWSASTGTDAAPYFRVFNPTLQSEKFDPRGEYIARWLPELAALPASYRHEPASAPPLVLAEAKLVLGRDYPLPIVEHAFARNRALAVFAPVLGKNAPKSSP